MCFYSVFSRAQTLYVHPIKLPRISLILTDNKIATRNTMVIKRQIIRLLSEIYRMVIKGDTTIILDYDGAVNEIQKKRKEKRK